MPGLSLTRDLGNGVQPAYHRITAIHMTADPPQTTVTITSYMAKVQSDSAKPVGVSQDYTFNGYPTGINFATVQGWVYDQLLLRPEWTGATKVA